MTRSELGPNRLLSLSVKRCLRVLDVSQSWALSFINFLFLVAVGLHHILAIAVMFVHVLEATVVIGKNVHLMLLLFRSLASLNRNLIVVAKNRTKVLPRVLALILRHDRWRCCKALIAYHEHF